MSFEPLPKNLELWVKRYAKQQHVSLDDALIMVVETGLQCMAAPAETGQGKNSAAELIGLFSSPEDCALMDEIVAIAYEGRTAAAARPITF